MAQADRPFLTEGGKEFTYAIEGDALRLSHANALLTRAVLADAWASMPSADHLGLPKHCQPRRYVWALLHDTRICGHAFLDEIPPALAKAARTQDKPAPKPKKKRRRAVKSSARHAVPQKAQG